MVRDTEHLERVYDYAASAYWYVQRHCHDEIGVRRAEQRDITRWSFEVVRGARPDVQPVTNLLIQFPPEEKGVPERVCPDNAVFVHDEPLALRRESYDIPFRPVGPFLVCEYHEKKPRHDERDLYAQLQVPYFLYLEGDALALFAFLNDGYAAVAKSAHGRFAIPELELEVALHDGWVRYWFRGELVPLPGEVLKQNYKPAG
jgi:hypothetical protein